MRTLWHLTGVLLFCAAFLLGKMMVEQRRRWAHALTPGKSESESLSRVFLYSGRTIETVSAVAGFLEVVAVLVLTL